MKVGSASDVGLVRSRNEDDLLAAEDRRMFLVADGLGGHPAGDVASRIAVETIDREMTLESISGGTDRAELLADMLRRAHDAIVADVSRSPERAGMGTTAVLALVGEGADEAWVAHVGDSRAYVARDGRLRQVTDDHRSGGPFGGGRITQALGTSNGIEPDVVHLDLETGDRLMLCTDGLSDMIDDGLVEQITTGVDAPQAACDDLVSAAKQAGGADNITVIVVDVSR